MSQEQSMQQAKVSIGSETTMNSPIKSSRKRRNNKKSKVSNCSTSENMTRSSDFNQRNSSSEQTVQKPAEDIHKQKKMYTIAIMLELSNLPVTLIEPEYMKNFDDLRITKPVEIHSSTQETLPSHIDFNLRPCYSGNSKYYNSEPSRKNNYCADNNNANINNFYNNNTRAEHHRVSNGNSYHDGNFRERKQQYSYNNKNTQPWHGNGFDSHRRSQNQGRQNNNSRFYGTNNTGSRVNTSFNNDTNGLRRNNTPEHETVHSNLKKRTVVHYSLEKSSIVELNTCENAWIPSCRNSKNPTHINEVETEEIQKKVRSILNKITPETMVVLTKTIIDMKISTYNSLDKIIELLFEKAIDEPNFTPQYAYICSQMKDIQVMSNDNKTNTSFKQLIVRKCQNTFELVSVAEKNSVKNLIEIESCKDQVLKKELQIKYDESERIQRKRSVGNCRFMCEMFKVKLLNSKVLEMCVRHLLKFPKEEPLECLCNILKHIGQYLNPENTYEKLREFLSTSYKTKISSRIRFMIMDIIELKNNNWVPRNVIIKPKTLSEIEKDFTMVSTNKQTIPAYIQPIKSPLEGYQNSNTQNVGITSYNVQMKSESFSNILQNKMNKPMSIKTNPESHKIESDLLTKNSEVELNTCKNAWVPRFRNSQKSTLTSEINIENIEKKVLEISKPEKTIKVIRDNNQEIEKKVQKLSKSVKPIKVITDNEQASCENFYSIVNSITQENLVTSTNKLISRITSINSMEETIDALFKRAMTESYSTSLIVEICSLLKGIILTTNNKSMHVSFKKQVAIRCQKLLQREMLEHNLETKTSIPSIETYTMIGELFNKKLLHINILIEFIKDIPDQLTDASIRNICHLFKIIGAEIERSYNLKPTIKKLEMYVNNDAKGLISPKYKDAVMNLLKLRDNKWIPVNIIDFPPLITKADQNVNTSLVEKPPSIPEERRKHGKNRRTKHARK